MSDKPEKPLTYREQIVLRLILIACKVVAGRSFEGGLDSGIKDALDKMNEKL